MVSNTPMSLPKGSLIYAIMAFEAEKYYGNFALAFDAYSSLLLEIYLASSGETQEKLERIIWQDTPVTIPTFQTERRATFSQTPDFTHKWIREFKDSGGEIVTPPPKNTRRLITLDASSVFHAKWRDDMDEVMLAGKKNPFLTCETTVHISHNERGNAYHLMMEDDTVMSIIHASDFDSTIDLLESIQDSKEKDERVFIPTLQISKTYDFNRSYCFEFLFNLWADLDFGLPHYGLLRSAHVNTNITLDTAGLNEERYQDSENQLKTVPRSGLVFDWPFFALWSCRGVPVFIARVDCPTPPPRKHHGSDNELPPIPFPCRGGGDWTAHRCRNLSPSESEKTMTR